MNPSIHHAAEEIGLHLTGLPPDPLVIDGQVFDPARHFAAWRKRDGTAMARLRLEAEDGLRLALAATPKGVGRWRAVAELLNARKVELLKARKVKTVRGGT